MKKLLLNAYLATAGIGVIWFVLSWFEIIIKVPAAGINPQYSPLNLLVLVTNLFA